jgi:NADH:ubiquinone oxidoreductase subunit K
MAGAGTRPVSATLVAVMFVAAGLLAAGVFTAAWRRDVTAALAGIPLIFAGAGVAFVGIARFAAAGGPHLFGQEFAILVAIAAVALLALGLGIAGREGAR